VAFGKLVPHVEFMYSAKSTPLTASESYIVIWGNVLVAPPQSEYMMLSWMPHEVALWLKRWLGVEALGTEQYILLNTPKFWAMAVLIGTCLAKRTRV